MSRLPLHLLVFILLIAQAIGQPGDLDASFGSLGKVVFTETSEAVSVIAMRDGKLLAGGSFRTGVYPSGVNKAALFRLFADGSKDTGFGSQGMVLLDVPGRVTSLREVDDGRVLAVVEHADFFQGSGIVRLNPDGSLDSTFGTGGSSPLVLVREPRAIALQPDGGILIAGYFWNVSHSDAVLVRYLPGGALDTSFGNQGLLTVQFGAGNEYATDVAVQPDGRVVMAAYTWTGTDWDFALARITSDGVLDPSFGTGGKVTTDFQNGYDLATGVLLLPDGKIVVAGGAGQSGGNTAAAVARYLPDGGLDIAFGIGGKMTLPVANGTCLVRDVALQKNGRMVVAGEIYTGPGLSIRQFFTARFNVDGSVDATFGGNGWIVAQAGLSSYSADSMALQSDGRIVMAGWSDFAHPLNSAVTVMRFEGDPTPPDVHTLAVSDVSETGITLRGSVNPNGTLTTAQFEFGTTASYGSTAVVTLMPGDGCAVQSVSAALTGLVPGTTYHYRLTGGNAAGTSFTVDGTFGTLISHEAWRQRHFGTTANAGPSADTFDFDQDGLSNLLEWACMSNPSASSVLPLATALSSGTIHFTYLRSISAMNAGMTFTVEWCDSLPGTNWSTSGVTHAVISAHGSFERVKATLPATPAGGPRFARLRVQ